jgi:hypothetical protein
LNTHCRKNAKPPFAGPAQVLTDLSRYTHRIAIANSRLMAMAEGKVTFRWRDYAHGHQTRTMTLAVDEFLRRFLLHVLPASFVRIRYFGLLANRPACGATTETDRHGQTTGLFSSASSLRPDNYRFARGLAIYGSRH